MRNLCILGLAGLLALPAAAAEPVAIVYSLAGEASLTAPNMAQRPLRLFERFPAGTIVEMSPDSRLALAFVNGLRYQLGGRSRVTIGRTDLSSRTGPVRALPRLPPLPPLSSIAPKDRPGARAGAVRIRAEEISGLHPSRGMATLAGATVLRFAPVGGADKYRIEVQGPRGDVIFAIETTASPVELSPGSLQPGTRYGWTVRTIDRVGPVARGEADFITLPARIAKAREALRKAIEALGDSELPALLAEVDRSLGLLAEEEKGVVIETVTPESLGARAGFRKGDLLSSWCRSSDSSTATCIAEGKLESPFDFQEVDLEEAPRGGVRFHGRRAGASMVWALLPGAQSVEVHPLLPEHLLRLHQEARNFAGSRPADAADRWRSAAVQAKHTGEDRLGIWFLSRAAGALAEARQWPQADALHGEAVDQATSPGETKITAQLLRTWGQTFQQRGSWNQAEDLYRRSLELDRVAGRDLAVAWTLHNLGTMAAQRSDFHGAETLLQQALKIREELAPRSSSLAKTLVNLGNLRILQRDLASAEDHLRHALSINEELAPGSFEVAGPLTNLGSVAMARGNFAGAEEHYRRAKAIYERTRPESLEMAKALKNLGLATEDRETAEYYQQRALTIEQKLDASGAAVAITLENLALLVDREDRKKAEEYLHRAMSLKEKFAPNGTGVASSLQNLGSIAIRWGDCTAAENYFQRAYSIRHKRSPDSLEVAESLNALGFLGLECGNLARAEDNYRRAVAIRERLAPRGISYAHLLHDLGETYRRQGRPLLAVEALCRAADIFESNREHVGRSRTEASEEILFTDCLAAQVDIGQRSEAFHVLERGRARAFLEQLAERDLLFSADLPEEIARRRREIEKEIESTQEGFGRLASTREAAETERLLHHLQELRDRQRELAAQIRKSSPRLASLQYPEPLDLAGARNALDPGTVLLSYSVGEEKSYLFVVHPLGVRGDGLSVFPIPVGAQALRETIGSFRNLLQNSNSDLDLLTSRAKELYDLLLGPAETQLASAKRLLVSANGPLHTLPFAALVRKAGYLVEWKPVHFVLSATVYAELKRTRRTSPEPEQSALVVFGDPIYPPLPKDRDTAPAATLEVLTAIRRGLSLDPIPGTRKEVESIASLYPGARKYLGEEATEERAKSVGSQARILHFACHGLLNERFPLDSALALTIPEHPVEGRDNGLLQAWEIFESVRLDADLVTLSACDSALGKEMGGEGLIGLTRAFQYAGARSVVASLWSVSDDSTADLMKSFYGYLREGRSKDEALRAAQTDLIRSQEFSHPYYWAAFQLTGDWK